MNLSPAHSDPSIDTALDDLEIGIGGVVVAFIIISVWAIGTSLLWTKVDTDRLPLWCLLLAILWQAFLYTGLFITAHDAMHGAVAPKHPALNRAIGQFSLFAYGMFSFDNMLKKHWQHHHHPASDLDPDFHNGKFTNPIGWYFYFMCRYWNWKRFILQVSVYHFLHLVGGISEPNLMLFWIVPALLGSLQLFYFGTYLPHSEPVGGYQDKFRAQSSYRPLWWSFITCYHFGYHHEHHRYPHLAWWQLPKAIEY
jgi:beta-carotene/zeaxanthin 4-ketolase